MFADQWAQAGSLRNLKYSAMCFLRNTHLFLMAPQIMLDCVFNLFSLPPSLPLSELRFEVVVSPAESGKTKFKVRTGPCKDTN